jgi:hypothetical protein
MQGFRCGLALVAQLLAITALPVVTAPQAVAINANQAGASAEIPESQTQTAAAASAASAKYDCPKPIHKHKRKSGPAHIQTSPPPQQTDCVAAPPAPPPIVGPVTPLPGQPIVRPIDQPRADPPPVDPPPVNERHGSYLPWVAAILEILGLFLLAREVLWGHQMEEIRKGMEFGTQVVYLHTRQDYDGAYLFIRLDQGDSPEKAREWIRILGPAAVKTAVDDEWTKIGRELPEKYRRYREETEPRAMRRRRLWLITGTGCLMIAAVIHIFA